MKRRGRWLVLFMAITLFFTTAFYSVPSYAAEGEE